MAEARRPDPDPPFPPQNIGLVALTGGESREVDNPIINPEQFPLTAAFADFCQTDTDYAAAPEEGRAALRTVLAHRFVRSVAYRRYNEGKGFLPESSVGLNLKRLHDRFGSVVPQDRVKERTRAEFRHKAMSHAAVFAGLPELQVAYELDSEVIEMEDPALMDTLETLIAAYGMTIKTLAKTPYPRRNE